MSKEKTYLLIIPNRVSRVQGRPVHICSVQVLSSVRGAVSVSYTHLDVYKRQVLHHYGMFSYTGERCTLFSAIIAAVMRT